MLRLLAALYVSNLAIAFRRITNTSSGGTSCVCLPREPDVVVHEDNLTVSYADHIAVTRQGVLLREFENVSGKRIHYSLAEYMHQEVVVIAVAKGCKPDAKDPDCARAGTGVTEVPVFVKRNDLCGVELFTTPALTCSKLGADGARTVATAVAHEMKSRVIPKEIHRGFGVELELVAWKIPKPLTDKAKKDFKKGRRFKAMKELGFKDYDTFIEEQGGFNLQVLEDCFVNTTAAPESIDNECSKNEDCALTQYCMDCAACSEIKSKKALNNSRSWISGLNIQPSVMLCKGCPSRSARICKKRSTCKKGLPVDHGLCPVAFQNWSWIADSSVKPLTNAEAEALLPKGDQEHEGSSFELVSPPLSGIEGMKSAITVMKVLKRIGVQAGVSSGMHVHVNVASSKVPGTTLSPTEIANVWVAFVKYQLVIDEMLSPSRVGNRYARSLFLGQCSSEALEKSRSGVCAPDHPCPCAKRFFEQMHAFIRFSANGTVADFCNDVLSLPGSRFPCQKQYPDQRYYALNLVPLTRLGTIEFRAHSATYDVERMHRWTQFVIAFVEHFGVDAPSAGASFFDDSIENDLIELTEAQRKASSLELFAALGNKVSADTHEYFVARSWEKGAPGCGTSARRGLSEHGSLRRRNRGHRRRNGRRRTTQSTMLNASQLI